MKVSLGYRVKTIDSNLRIGLLSLSTLTTRNVSNRKNPTMQISGKRRYRMYNPMFWLGAWWLDSKRPVHVKAVSRAMYPVPTKRMRAEVISRPRETAVPSSMSW